MVVYAMAAGEKYTFFLLDHYIIIANGRIQEGTVLNFKNDGADTYDYHVLSCCENAFKDISYE